MNDKIEQAAGVKNKQTEGLEKSAQALQLENVGDVATEQRKQAIIKGIIDRVSDKKDISVETRANLEKLVDTLILNAINNKDFSKGLSLKQAAIDIEKQLNDLAQANNPQKFAVIVAQLSRVALATSGPQDFRAHTAEIAADLLVELASPSLNIHQGRSLACAVTAREYIKKHPEIYAEFIADIVNDGYGYIGRSANGARSGLMSYKEGMLGDLAGRTKGCAIYEDILLNTLGSPEEGLMPADVERLMEARGQPAVLMTANGDISEKPNNPDDIIKAIKSCAAQGKSGLVSLDFMDTEIHNKHVLEICSDQNVPQGYIKLSNPWEPGTPLPPQISAMVKDNGDGTFLIKEEDLKKRLYFAVLEADNDTQFGVTDGVKEGQYKRDEMAAQSNTGQLSYFGFSQLSDAALKKSNNAVKEIQSSQAEPPIRSETDNREGASNDNLKKQPAADSQSEEGARYFASLSAKAMFPRS